MAARWKRVALMSYRMVLGSEAARAPVGAGVLGYLYNHGGLNNQKMALAGLLQAGIRERMPINLPYIYNRDQKTDEEYVVRIEEIFDLDRILDFGRRHGVTILTECPGGERGGWKYFFEYAEGLKSTLDSRRQLDLILDAALSLQPRLTATPLFVQMKDVIQARIDTVVQLRIEADWQAQAEFIQARWGEEEGSGLGYMAILSKVRKTFPDLRIVYVTCDEKSMPVSKYEIRAVSRAQFDLDILWKSDLLAAGVVEKLTPLDLSIIDYEIARLSPRFIGLTTSSFTTMLSVERLASTRKPVRGHYFYNNAHDVVIERLDSGFTPPAEVDPLLAEGG
jgi:hypothetical protein